MIVAFVAAMDKFITGELNLERIHIYSQLVNAFVQNKIGSGFDIACAIYGSQIYRRFTNGE